MKAIIINKYGGSEVLEYVDMAKPEPAPDEIRIETRAISLNPVDWKVRLGRLKIITGKKFPMGLGVEAAGVIDSIGSEVQDLKPGMPVFIGKNHVGGCYAEYVTVKAENAVLLPENMPFEEACTFAVAGVTAYQALTSHAGLEEGMDVLIHGASGGLGTYAVQVANILGANVTAVCSTKNVKLVDSLGADRVIDYTKKDWALQKQNYDIIIDAVGNKTYRQVKPRLKKGGMLIKLNFSTKTWFDQRFTSLISSKKVKFVLLKNIKEDVKWIRDQIALGKIKVIIDKTFSLSEVRKAHEYSETGRARGKIVLLP